MTLLTVDKAKALIVAQVKPLSAETIPLNAARSRVLARDLKAKRDQPPFPASAMDGYAVNSADVDVPGRKLRLVGMSAAGHGFRGQLKRGETVRIFTGAPVPQGADAILIQENSVAEAGWIIAKKAVTSGLHVRRQALDYKSGEILMKAGRSLTARDIGLAASMNYASLPVRQKPIVAILATGDELVEPGQRPRRDQIVGSNSSAMAAFVEWGGGLPEIIPAVGDNESQIRAAMRKARHANILVTTGGASVGTHDLISSALAAEGIRLTFWKIAMRPGKPMLFAIRGKQRIIGLPGNPVSALVCARIFVKPLIDRFLGAPSDEPRIEAVLTQAMRANDERQEYARGRFAGRKDGLLIVTPFPLQDSSMLRFLAEADCLIVRPPYAEAAVAGDRVEILPIDF
jgi:molybdopterin molybdotransferase